MTTRKRHTPEQAVRKLAQAGRMLGDGKDVGDACREMQISEQTYYRWHNQFGGAAAPGSSSRRRNSEHQVDHDGEGTGPTALASLGPRPASEDAGINVFGRLGHHRLSPVGQCSMRSSDGQCDPAELAELAKRRLRSKIPALTEALTVSSRVRRGRGSDGIV
jgi:Transposase